MTAVLIGAETASRKWVRYEIAESIDKGNGLIGIRIHQMKDLNGYTSTKGENPFMRNWTRNGRSLDTASVPVYDWVANDGYNNLGAWVTSAHIVK